MTVEPGNYRQLPAHLELIPKIRTFEDQVNARPMMFIRMQKLVKTGDIVGVSTTEAGIDIAHTGLVYRDANGVAHFMDGSSGKDTMRVTIEPGPIGEALNWSVKLNGAMFACPLEPQSQSARYAGK